MRFMGLTATLAAVLMMSTIFTDGGRQCNRGLAGLRQPSVELFSQHVLCCDGLVFAVAQASALGAVHTHLLYTFRDGIAGIRLA